MSSEGLFPDSRAEIPTDDWDDQDLLTKDEAGQRLVFSADSIRSQLEAGVEPPQAAQLQEKLRLIEIALSNIRR